MKKNLTLLIGLMLVFGLMLGACQPAASDTADATEEPMDDPVEEPMDDPTEEPMEEPMDDERVQVRWFVGLGAGSDEPTIAPQEAVVEKFNASQDRIELVLEIVDNGVAYDTLATQIAAGNAPDLVGPVGIKGRDSFQGAWLDLQPYIDANSYDLSDFDPALVEFYQVKEEGQLGIPFAIFPSFMMYNADLFDEAGLPYPPQEYGAPYVDENGEEQVWDMDTLRDLAMKLSVDANGADATMDSYDTENIVQFGFQNMWTDLRGVGTFFGAGSLVDDDGNAQVPANWEAAWRWQNDGWWTDYFIPNGPYGGADFLQSPGGGFGSGNLAMIHMHLWFVAPWAMGDVDFAWDLAATPSYDGTVTSKMHADTFGILKGAEHPDEAFEVLTYLLSEEGASGLLNIYGGMPARISMQADYFDNYGATNFPDQDINWQVVVDSMAFADNPNHESWMPSYQETNDRYNEFSNLLANDPEADFDAGLAELLEDLQSIFDAAR